MCTLEVDVVSVNMVQAVKDEHIRDYPASAPPASPALAPCHPTPTPAPDHPAPSPAPAPGHPAQPLLPDGLPALSVCAVDDCGRLLRAENLLQLHLSVRLFGIEHVDRRTQSCLQS